MTIGLIATSLLASCKKNNGNDNGGTADGKGFRATTEQGAGNPTRTHIEGLNPTDGGSSAVLWDAADLIKVRSQENGGRTLTYQLTEGENTTDGTFYTGEEHENFFQPNYTAIYPAFNADEVANIITGDGTATFNLPATQTYVEGSFAKGAMPMMAVSNNQTLSFKNVLGGLCFPMVGNLTVKRIVLTSANGDDCLNGVFNANYNGGEPTLSHSADGTNSITLVCNPAVQLDANTPTDFIIMLPPGMLESGFSITAYDETDNPIYTNGTSTAPGEGFIARNLIRKTNDNLEVLEYTVNVSANPTAGGTVTGGNIYHVGDNCTVTATANSGYAFTNWTEDGTVVSTNASFSFVVTDNRNLVANFRVVIPGAIGGLYSVAANRKVYFSQGNLQWSATGGGSTATTHGVYGGGTAEGTWRFAENQWDFVGRAGGNLNPGANQSAWMDLFCWGTSGWNSGAKKYQPYEWGSTHSDYRPGNNKNNDLTGTYARADWGVYNDIQAGELTIPANTYRTLTSAEWGYLMQTRRVTVNRMQIEGYGLGTVNGKHGLILVPDDWDGSLCGNFHYKNGGYDSNVFDETTTPTWSEMEAAGCVFLPAAERYNYNGSVSTSDADRYYYWSSTHNDVSSTNSDQAYGLSSSNPAAGLQRRMRQSVRLVKDAN